MLILVGICTVLGLLIGSFLNVVIWRVPRGESVVSPRSRCPECRTPIRPRDEIPVLSWLLLRGRCRDCGEQISVRYPAIELATAVLFAAVAARFARVGVMPDGIRALPAFLFLAALGVALAMIDIDTKRLPNTLTLPSYGVALVLLGAATVTGVPSDALLRAVAGMAVMFIVYFAFWFAVPAGMGFGDVKLSGVLGVYLGWLGWGVLAVGLLAGWVIGGVFGMALLAFGKAGRKTKIPFGPFMVAGAMLAVLAGEPIARVWLRGTL